MRLGLILLAGCGPAVVEVLPVQGSALGGEVVTLRGARLPAEPEVRFGGALAEATRVDRRTLEVVTPPGVAGVVDVTVAGRQDGTLEGGFTYVPLDLAFAEAPAHYLPEPAGTTTAAVAGDLDGDGVAEVVLVQDGALSVWWNSGLGGFVEGLAPAVDAPVGGVAFLSEGRLFTCPAGEGDPLRLTWDGERWGPNGALPASAPCHGVRALTLAGEEVLAELGDDGLRLRTADSGPGADGWPTDVAVSGGASDVVLLDDALVIGTLEGPLLTEAGPAGWREAAVGRLPASDCAVGAMDVLDVEGDGEAELAVACADGQDRLYRGDGQGHYFEDSAASLPVDAAVGAALAHADLDLDGLPELIVGNRGGVDRLYRGDGARFEDWSARLSLTIADTVAALPMDVDADGAVDLLLVDADGARLFVNVGE
ncbi:MAG: VCBS repeat-containing protein [Alphaproteobacteria bacterium]|nr:VCBS repeat-containing protein [Alphaproteobacteria bacterium]